MSRNRRKQSAPSAAPQVKRWMAGDSFQNFEARLGIGTNNQSSSASYGFDFISRNRIQLEAMYRSSWIVGQAVDCVAEDMTRAGISIASTMDPDDQEVLTEALERMRIWDHLCDTIKWSRLYGGALAVMLIDGQQMNTPLNIDAIGEGQFKGMFVLDRWLVQPSLNELVTELGPEMGMPKYYDVVADSMALKRQRIHHSRVLRMDGIDLPYWQKISENLWGQSVIERLFDRLVAFDSTTQGAAQLVYKAHLRTIKIEGLRDIIATGGPALNGLVSQIEMMRRYQTNEGITLLDAKDEFEASTYTFAGLSDMMLQFAQQLSGALQIPMVRLFGQSPAGLNATGESDMEQYRDGITQKQERRLRSPITKLLQVMCRSELGKEPPEGFGFDFNSLSELTETEKADIAGKVALAVGGATEDGTIDQATALKELKQSSEVTGIFTNITDEMITDAENAPPPVKEVDPPPGGAQNDDTNKAPKGAFSLDEAWSESDHPRAENGEFGTGGGSSSSKAKLTANEKSALSSYSGDDFLRINKDLRAGNTSDPMVARIDSAIEKSEIPAGQPVYRGMTREAAKKLFPSGKIEAGAVVSDPAYASTSKSSNEAHMRALGGVLLKIETKPGAKGIDMTAHSRNAQEQEVLLPRNAKMTVLGTVPPKKVGDPVIVRVSYGE